MAKEMTFEELLAHTKRQLAGVQKKADTITDPHLRIPYDNQIAGLTKKVEKLEELLKWKEPSSDTPILQNVKAEKGAAR